jgi:hypothetical protein
VKSKHEAKKIKLLREPAVILQALLSSKLITTLFRKIKLSP